MKKVKNTGFKHYFCDCNCDENSFSTPKEAINHYINCNNCKNIIYKSLYEQTFDDKGRMCYPYERGKN